MLDFHAYSGAEGTIAVTEVADPSRYGVVQYNTESSFGGLISGFYEKPKDSSYGNRINAGIYLFSTEIIKRVKPVPMFLELDVFPRMAQDKVLFAYDMDGFWKDIGTPQEFLTGTFLYLHSITQTNTNLLYKGKNIKSSVIVVIR